MSLRAAALIVALVLAWPLPSLGQAALPHLIVNEADLTRSTTPQIQDGVLLLPVDLLARAFGAAAAWDAARPAGAARSARWHAVGSRGRGAPGARRVRRGRGRRTHAVRARAGDQC